jgi:transcriptional accessory protein Tex/SPT6
MANVDDGVLSPDKAGEQPGAPARTRAGKPSSPAVKPIDADIDPAEFKELLGLYDNSFRNIAEGEVVKGTVLKVTGSEVVVDVGYKSEGIIPISEFLDETGQVTVQAGDTVDVLLERTEDREGHIVLSREKAEKMKIWDEVERPMRNARSSSAASSSASREDLPSTSACARSFPVHRST